MILACDVGSRLESTVVRSARAPAGHRLGVSVSASRIEAARHKAAVVKQGIAVGAVTLFGLLVLFLRAGHSTASNGTSGEAVATAEDEAYDDGALGGGAIGQPSQSYGYPSAQTRTS